MIKTNDIKKEERIRLRNGWYATMEDNLRGNTRVATVEGHVTEIGSVYSHDIMYVERDGAWQPVTHTPSQDRLRSDLGRMHMR